METACVAVLVDNYNFYMKKIPCAMCRHTPFLCMAVVLRFLVIISTISF